MFETFLDKENEKETYVFRLPYPINTQLDAERKEYVLTLKDEDLLDLYFTLKTAVCQ